MSEGEQATKPYQGERKNSLSDISEGSFENDEKASLAPSTDKEKKSTSLLPSAKNDNSRDSGSTIPIRRENESELSSSDDDEETTENQPQERQFFACNHCSKRFAAFSSLQGHIEIWHNDVAASDSDHQQMTQRSISPESDNDRQPQTPESSTKNDAPENDNPQSSNQLKSQSDRSVKNKKKKSRKTCIFSSKRTLPKKRKKIPSACPLCGKIYSSVSNLKRHVNDAHNLDSKTGVLPVAEATTGGGKSHEKENEYSNEEESKVSFEDESDTSSEDENVTNDIDQSTLINTKTCRYCKKTFSRSIYRRDHETKRVCIRDGTGNYNEREDTPKDTTVEERDASSEEENVTNNMNKVPSTSTKSTSCQYCQKIFSSSANRRKHEKKRICIRDNTAYDNETGDTPEATTVGRKSHEEEYESSLKDHDTSSDEEDIKNDICQSTLINTKTCRYCKKTFSRSVYRRDHETNRECIRDGTGNYNVKEDMWKDTTVKEKSKVSREEESDASGEEEDATNNMNKLPSNSTTSCQYCKKTFSFIHNRRRHEISQICVRQKTDNGHETGYTLEAAAVGGKSHEEKNENSFEECDTTSDEEDNKNDLDQTASSLTNSKICRYCKKTFSRVSNRREHETKRVCIRDGTGNYYESEDTPKSTTVEEESKMSLEECETSSDEENNKNDIGQSVSTSTKSTCQYCKKSFSSSANRRKHEKKRVCIRDGTGNYYESEDTPKSTTVEEESKVSLEECETSSDEENNKNDIGQTVSISTKSTSCQYCKKSFSSSANRRKHEKKRVCVRDKTDNESLEKSLSKIGSQKQTAMGSNCSKNSTVGSDISSITNRKRKRRNSGSSNSNVLPSFPSGPPHKSRQRLVVAQPRLPVQLTWKGVQIYFPVVTLSEELKNRADEAWEKKKQKESKHSTSTSTNSNNSDYKKISKDESPSNKSAHEDSEQDPDETSCDPNIEPPTIQPHAKPKWKLKGNCVSTSSSTGENSKNTICKICSRDCKNGYSLKRHIKLHCLKTGSYVRKFGPCDKCGLRFASSKMFQEHIAGCSLKLGEASTSRKSFSSENTEKVETSYPNSADVDFDYDYGIKIERPDCSEDFRDNFAESDHGDPVSANDEESQPNDSFSDADQSFQPKITQAWGNAFLEKYEEKQKLNQSSKLGSEALKETLRQKVIANRRSTRIPEEPFQRKSQTINTKTDSPVEPNIDFINTTKSNVTSIKCQDCDAYISSGKMNAHQVLCPKMIQPVNFCGRLRKYHCTHCKWKFMTTKDLRKHTMKRHADKEPQNLSASSDYNTQPISSRPTSVSQISNSNDAVSSKLPFECNICGKRFRRRVNMNQHQVTHNVYSQAAQKKKKISCHVCGKRFLLNSELVKHARTHQGEVSKMSNSTRAMTFGTNLSFNNTNNPSYKTIKDRRANCDKKLACHVCNKRFLYNSDLLRHIKTHKGGLRTDTPATVTVPLHSHTNDEDGSLNTSTSNDKETHSRISSSAKPYICHACGKTFSQINYLRQHSVVHDSSRMAARTCNVCNYEFPTYDLYRRHLKSCRTKNLSSKNIGSGQNGNENNTADDEEDQLTVDAYGNVVTSPSFKCDQCGQNFGNKVDLSRHCLSHAMDMNDDAFSSNGYANPKSQSISVGSQLIPPPSSSTAGLVYTCKYKNCQHGFSHDEDLWYHIEKKHKSMDILCCHECGKDCESEGILLQHCREIHPKAQSSLENAIVENVQTEEKSPVIVKIEASELEQESNYDDGEDHHFSDQEYNNPPENENEQHLPENGDSTVGETCEPDPSLLIPKTELLEIEDPHNPVVLISAECKSAAENALMKLYERQGWPVYSSIFDNLIQAERKEGKVRTDIPFQDEYECTLCPGSNIFDNRNAFIAHMDDHEKHTSGGLKRGPKFDQEIPLQDVYRCDKCPGDKSFTERKSYISHLNYHRFMREQGREHVIGRIRKPSEFLPIQSEYSCDICPNKTFTDRQSYILHRNYHKRRQQMGRDGSLGVERARRRKDIPYQDEYTCNKCPERTFTERGQYITHLNYHKRMEEMSIDKPVGIKRPFRRDDIPVQDSYTCEKCTDRTFTSRNSYLLHLSYHKKMRELGKEYAIGQGRWSQRHRRVDIPFQDEYTCSRCPEKRIFTDRTAYLNHDNYHKIMRKKGREHTIGKGRGFGVHRTDIPIQDVYTCDLCEDQKTFTDRQLYITHKNYHEQSRRKVLKGSVRRRRRGTKSDFSNIPYQDFYTCDFCDDRTFTSRNSYIAHLQYHEILKKQGNNRAIAKREDRFRSDIPIQDVYTCEKCEDRKTFTDRAKYINHIYYHETLSKKKITRQPFSRLIPIQSVYRCKICTDIKTFTDRQKYINHLHYHKMREKSLAEMSSALVTQIAGSMHEDVQRQQEMLDKIPDQEKYVCLTCGEEKVFTNKNAFARHLQYHKTMKNKPYQCTFCEKAYSNAWNLTQHVKTHTGEKAFVCGDCGKRFIYKYSMQRHQDQFCQKIPCKYTCHCGDKFHNIKSLETHVKRFHNEKSNPDQSPKSVVVPKVYRCYVCDQEFNLSTDLSQHVMEFHPNDYMEFMQQKEASTSAIANAVALAHQTVALHQNKPEPVEDDEQFNGNLIPEVVFEDDDAPVEEESNVVELPPKESSWNFIPGLEGNDDENSDDDDMDYYDEESFEPEDIEVEGCVPMEVDSSIENHLDTSQHNMTTEAGRSEFNSHATYEQEEPPVQPRIRKPKGPDRFQCGYCDKKSHELKFIKSHKTRFHKELPFKFREIGTTLIGASTFINVNGRFTPDDQRNQTRDTNATREMPVLTSMNLEKDTKPITMERTASNIDGVRKSTDRNGSQKRNRCKPKSLLECGCEFSDTALAYFKRCTGEGCQCYLNTKGCSEKCKCQGNCNNPYFRAKPSLKPLPNLVPVSYMVPSRPLGQRGTEYTAESSSNNSTSNSEKVSLPSDAVRFRIIQKNSVNNSGEQQYQLSIVDSAAKSQLATDSVTSSPLLQNVLSMPTLSTSHTKYLSSTSNDSAINQVNQKSNNPINETSNFVPPTQHQTQVSGLGQKDDHEMELLDHNNSMLDKLLNHQRSQNVPSNFNPSTNSQNTSEDVRSYNDKILTTLITNLLNKNDEIQKKSSAPSTSSSTGKQNQAQRHCGYRCVHCDRLLPTLQTFIDHQYDHREKFRFMCPVCPKEFSLISHLTLHCKTHPEAKGISLCQICKASFDTNELLNWHMEVYHSDVQCKYCKLVFETNTLLKEHMKSVHYLCEICGEVYNLKMYYTRHLATSHNITTNDEIRLSSLPTASTSSVSAPQINQSHSKNIQVVDLDDDDVIIVESRPPSPPAEFPVIVASTSLAPRE